MEIKGKIVQILPLQGGQTKAGGEWKKQEYILETEGQYPKKVCFNLWGDRIEQYPVAEGEEVTVSFDLDSREFNGRWYTEVRAWKIEKGTPVLEKAAASVKEKAIEVTKQVLSKLENN